MSTTWYTIVSVMLLTICGPVISTLSVYVLCFLDKSPCIHTTHCSIVVQRQSLVWFKNGSEVSNCGRCDDD